MKKIWNKCWGEFVNWFVPQWKCAWELLSKSIVGLVLAIFQWAKTIIGAAGAGLWKLVIKPVGKWCCETLVDWIKKI